MTTVSVELSPYHRIELRTAVEHRLFSAIWELTHRCNEACSHCYLSRPRGGAGELSTEEARSVVDQLADLGALYLTLTGGEALLRKDFFAIAGYAREKGFALRLMTNGTPITPRTADAIRDLQPVAVEMSLLGSIAETHYALSKVPGSFVRTVRAFRLLADRGVRTVVKNPVMNENVDELDQVRALATELGASFLYDISITARDSGCTSTLRHRLTEVIHPPVYTGAFRTNGQPGGYYLVVSQLMPYKMVEVAVQAFNELGLPLKIVGEGPLRNTLGRMARGNIEFLGWQPDARLAELYSRCLALVFPTFEDFGLTPLEAQACGRPVRAYGAGGALETVVDGMTGVFFPEQSAESLARAVQDFRPFDFDPQKIREHAEEFDVQRFKTRIGQFVQEKYREHRERMGEGVLQGAW